jgi:hypothetical protein
MNRKTNGIIYNKKIPVVEVLDQLAIKKKKNKKKNTNMPPCPYAPDRGC